MYGYTQNTPNKDRDRKSERKSEREAESDIRSWVDS
jgi:hypothetical protein